jgi:hypothetical protein
MGSMPLTRRAANQIYAGMKHVPPLIGLVALTASAPVIEAIFAPAEECHLSAPCSFGMQWSPDAPERNNAADLPSITPRVETSGTTSAGSGPTPGSTVIVGQEWPWHPSSPSVWPGAQGLRG